MGSETIRRGFKQVAKFLVVYFEVQALIPSSELSAS